MWDHLLNYYGSLSGFGKTAIVLNVALFVLAGVLFHKVVPFESDQQARARVLRLRLINVFLLLFYITDWVVNFYVLGKTQHSEIFIRLSQTGLVLLITYLMINFAHSWTIKRFGKPRDIDDERVHTRTYQSEIIHIIIVLVTLIIGILLLINIWQVTSWLQATGVIGGLLVILFATKESWSHDAVNGLILLYNRDLEPGVVCRIEALDILAVTRRISLTQTSFQDLLQKHRIVVTNSVLRNSKIEILHRVGSSHWQDYVEFNIGYDTPSETVEKFIQAVWQRAAENEGGLDVERKPTLYLAEAGDHAVRWRVSYPVDSVYRIKQARFALQRAAFDLQSEHGLSLATPLTHQAMLLNRSKGGEESNDD